jgi:hypothetical protein
LHVQSSGIIYSALVPRVTVTITATVTPSIAAFTYGVARATLALTVRGLPDGTDGMVSVTGPGGYAATAAASQTFSEIPPGAYTVTASTVGQSCGAFEPTPTTQVLTIASGQTGNATVDYISENGPGFNICIDGAYITQSVQTYSGSVPLVAGRSARLRVFVRSTESNTAKPQIRARFYTGQTLAQTFTTVMNADVPTVIDEGNVAAAGHIDLPAGFLQPGMSMLLDVDPSNTITESNDLDNSFPKSGQPAALDIRNVQPLRLTLVPVTQSATGLTGAVDAGNLPSWIQPTLSMFPVPDIQAQLHDPILFNGPELGSTGANWNTLLSELNAIRVTEATGRHYYGVVKVSHTSGVAGLGYIGAPASIGWDRLPSGPEVMAHELGHNFGRLHAPCGSPAGADQAYPYPGAATGRWGFDPYAPTDPKPPTYSDLMSYCNPAWISDYTYLGILNYRGFSSGMLARTAAAAPVRGLLIWGRIENGHPILEPAFEVDAPASLPVMGGPHRLEGFGPGNQSLFEYSFAGDAVADAPDPSARTFAFVVPLSQLRGVHLTRLRLTSGGRAAEHHAGAGPRPASARRAAGRVEISWDAAARGALVRNARSGQVVAISRGRSAMLPASFDDLEVTVSDGIRSTRTRVKPQ